MGRTCYVKHLTVFDQTEIDSIYEEAVETAKQRGIPTEAAKLADLEAKKAWTKKDDQDVSMQRAYVENLYKTRAKLLTQAQLKQTNGQIAEAENSLNKLLEKRANLIGKTADQIGDQRVQYEYIRASFFADVKLQGQLFSRADIRELTDEEAEQLLMIYVGSVSQMGPDTLRKIVIQPFFTNFFYLCGDDLTRFFQKPIYELSVYQANLLSYAQYFKRIMTENDIPKEFLNNPDKIEEYILRSRNQKAMADKMAANADRVAIIGATSEDFKMMGVEDGSKTVRADIQRGIKSGLDALKTREATPR